MAEVCAQTLSLSIDPIKLQKSAGFCLGRGKRGIRGTPPNGEKPSRGVSGSWIIHWGCVHFVRLKLGGKFISFFDLFLVRSCSGVGAGQSLGSLFLYSVAFGGGSCTWTIDGFVGGSQSLSDHWDVWASSICFCMLLGCCTSSAGSSLRNCCCD